MKTKVSFIAQSQNTSAKLNITSLMDVLTIILIFLLVNYSSIEQDMQVPTFITLPTVDGQITDYAVPNLKIVIGKDRLKINEGQEIHFKNFDQQKDKILEKLSIVMQKVKTENNKTKTPTILAIQADKQIPYQVIDGIILSAANEGITQIELISLKKPE